MKASNVPGNGLALSPEAMERLAGLGEVMARVSGQLSPELQRTVAGVAASPEFRDLQRTFRQLDRTFSKVKGLR